MTFSFNLNLNLKTLTYLQGENATNITNDIPDLDEPLDGNDELLFNESIKCFIAESNIPLNSVKNLLGLLELQKSLLHSNKISFSSEITPSSLICKNSNYILSTKDICPECSSNLHSNLFCPICDLLVKKPSRLAIGDISTQLKDLFNDPTFFFSVSETHRRCRNLENCFEDVYSGSIHKEFISNYTENDISVCFNTDGVEFLSTSSESMWVMLMTVNEIPFKFRKLLNNLIILGVYCGTKKPAFEAILPLIFDDQKDIFDDGLNVNGTIHKIVLMQNICDKPARAALLNHTGHHSQYGCIKCLKEQEFQRDSFGRGHYYFDVGDASQLLRTDAAYKAVASSTMISGVESQYGIKGNFFLNNFPSFLPVTGSIIDELHCLGGCAKSMMNLLFSEKYKRYSFNIRDQIKSINCQISELRPPPTIVKRIRNLDSMSNFRGHEYRSFLLYHGPILLKGHMRSNIQFKNFCLLSSIMHKCSAQTITENLLESLHVDIKDFFESFILVYGKMFLTCYIFENFNKMLKNLTHGTNKIEKELFKRFELKVFFYIFLSVYGLKGQIPKNFQNSRKRRKQ